MTFGNTTQTLVTSILLLSLTHNVPATIDTKRDNFTLTKTRYSNIDEMTAWNPLLRNVDLIQSQLAQVPQLFLRDETAHEYLLDYQKIAMSGTLKSIAKHYNYTVEQTGIWIPNDWLETSKLSIPRLFTEEWRWTQKSIIHPTLPQFIFKLIGTQERPDDDIEIKTIEIHQDNESQPIQIIKTSAIPTITEDYVAFKIEDFNFDGYKDISLMQFSGLVNAQYIYWLFEPKLGTFIQNAQFSEMITSPWEIDSENHSILSYWRWNALHQGTNYYKIINNQPVLVRQEEEIFMSEDIMKVIVSERVGNEMKIISETIQPYFEEE